MAATIEGQNFIWSKSIPRKGWIYEGDVNDLESVTGKCQMCDHPIRYEHLITHPEYGQLKVGSQCAMKMSEEGGLSNHTGWKITDASDPYLVVTEKKFARSKRGFLQLKLPKGSVLYKTIADLSTTNWGQNIFVYPDGGIYVPNRTEYMKELLEKKNPVLLLIKRKIKAAYDKKLNWQ